VLYQVVNLGQLRSTSINSTGNTFVLVYPASGIALAPCPVHIQRDGSPTGQSMKFTFRTARDLCKTQFKMGHRVRPPVGRLCLPHPHKTSDHTYPE
jgi:hypothetical protein